MLKLSPGAQLRVGGGVGARTPTKSYLNKLTKETCAPPPPPTRKAPVPPPEAYLRHWLSLIHALRESPEVLYVIALISPKAEKYNDDGQWNVTYFIGLTIKWSQGCYSDT